MKSTVASHPAAHVPCAWLFATALILSAATGITKAADSTPTPDTRVSASLSASSISPELRLSSSAYQHPTFPGSSFDSGVHQPWAASRGPIQLLEAPRDFTPGIPARRSPRFALGFRSNALRNGLNTLGIDAQTCMAPILRLRGKLSSGGDINSTFWISARCSFW